MKKIALLITASVIIFSSCNKSSDATPSSPSSPAATSTPSAVPHYADAYGVLAAVKTNSWISAPVIGAYLLETGVAVAVFNDTPGSSVYVDAGTVKCDDSTLTKNAQNAYVFTPTANVEGLTFSSGNAGWNVTGSPAVGAFSYSTVNGFPQIDSVDNRGTISKSADFTLRATGSVSNNDSVVFVVGGPSATLMKTKAANTSSCTFTAAEMMTVGTGSTILEIAPYRVNMQVLNGKKYYFINESVVTRQVTVQ